MSERNIESIVRGVNAIDGAGVRLVRVLGLSTVESFNPFLMLDAFDSDNPDDYVRGFPMHPHRGIETFTYLMEGEIEHQDSLGHKGTIEDGCAQWMTAGSGILHQEMPLRGPRLLGLQLWLNLPSKDKMTEPRYHDIRRENIPVIVEEGAEVSVVAGTYAGSGGEARGAASGEYLPMTFLDVRLEPGAEWAWRPREGDTVFVYTVRGSLFSRSRQNTAGKTGEGAEQEIPARRAALFSKDGAVRLRAGADGSRFVVAAAPAVHETVAWGGPIVMNTEEELRQAFRELQEGTFLRHEPRSA